MNKIRILPDNLANQIAAGEVVERPASVIKELLENALDAGSGRITIDVELGGRRLMRIADDGHGMGRDDAVLAFERHATSKIRDLDDLGRIGTLGFRGEALASIASVARIELVTKVEEDSAATRVEIEGGRLTDVSDAPRATGTTVSVRDLFFNTPARRKFMRSEATENYHLTSIIQHYALAYPHIAFALNNNGRSVINVSPAKDLRERAFQLFGGGLLESLLPVSGGREFVATLSGFVSAPRERRTNRDSQYYFVNRRFVRDKAIAEGIREGYRSVLPHGYYPVAFLFLDIPVEEVDVNVHPAKTEVRFRRRDAVKDVIAEAVRESLAKAGIDSAESANRESSQAWEARYDEAAAASSFVETKGEEEREPSVAAITEQLPARSEQTAADIAESPSLFSTDEVSSFDSMDFEIEAEARAIKMPRASVVSADESFAQSEASVYPVLPPVDSAAKIAKTAEVAEIPTRSIRPVGQLHESFIIAVDEEGLLLIDQHVAHERILFDRFRRAEYGKPLESQNLLIPETLDLTPAEAEVFESVAETLSALGFDVMRLSGRTIAIKAVPADLPPAEGRMLLKELLASFEGRGRSGAESSIRDDIAASLACKAAIKINMPLTQEKMAWLIDRLLVTSSPTTCPHGRPVILRLTMRDIERGFHRT